MDLSGKLLIAMPGMADPRFQKSVIFLCAHSDEGAMGLVINHPARELSFPLLLEQLSIDPGAGQAPMPVVYLGGPVEHARGFVLHSADYHGAAGTLQVDARFGMTATMDILEDIARGIGPHDCLLALGYSGWGPGQIETELQENAWLVGEANEQIVFSADSSAKWTAALALMGIDPLTLSGAAGRA
ncbi:YqgE/AlgH family protein [Fluviibacterium sp. DFM31]|uniref:UPF0301 protein AB0T83_02635 n=1 Tax=Meridianimarinicoccus marinus TaxID=3231483 RepID=A0ABV3L3N6_9RHOB